jgi:hypothetical protein
VAKKFWVSLLGTFSNFNCFLLYCANLILYGTQEHFSLVEVVSIEMANIVFNISAWKVIKDVVKHACLVSTALYYSQVLKHLLYLMVNYYLTIIFGVLLTGAEAADKAQPAAGYLPNQVAVASRQG